MKGVGKFGEVLAGEKGKVSYDEVAARLEKIIHSGSQRKPITDFVCRELRKIPHYTWVGIYNVDGSELVLASWSGPSASTAWVVGWRRRYAATLLWMTVGSSPLSIVACL